MKIIFYVSVSPASGGGDRNRIFHKLLIVIFYHKTICLSSIQLHTK